MEAKAPCLNAAGSRERWDVTADVDLPFLGAFIEVLGPDSSGEPVSIRLNS